MYTDSMVQDLVHKSRDPRTEPESKSMSKPTHLGNFKVMLVLPLVRLMSSRNYGSVLLFSALISLPGDTRLTMCLCYQEMTLLPARC